MADLITRKMIVDYVQPEVRDWQGKNGTLYFVTVNFGDRSQGSVLCGTKEVAGEVQGILENLRNTEVEFSLEPDGEYKGTPKYRIKEFPGKPASVGGGGGGGSRGGGGGMSHAQAGLMAAASIVGVNAQTLDATSPGDQDLLVAATIEIAEKFTDHLFTRRQGEQQAAGGEAPAPSGGAPSASAPADPITLVQMHRIRELAKARGVEDIPAAVGVRALGDLTGTDADTLIASWG